MGTAVFDKTRILLLLLTTASAALAQESRATVLGRIAEITSGVLPGSRITLTNLDTEVRYSTESNGAGNYVAPYLPPGTYRVRVEREGFSAWEHSPIALRIADCLRVDVTLELGHTAEKVTVTTETSPLEREGSSIASIVDGRRIVELPIAHGNVYHLTRLTPGVAFAGNANYDRPYDPSHIANYALGGGYGLRNEITLDGSPNSSMTAGRNQAAAAYVPPADIIGEMRVTTVALDAAIGHTEGGAIGISLKSGTNTLHGTAYYNSQRPELTANSWMGNQSGIPRGDFAYHRWGASVLGPMRLPRLYDGRNRTFFLWGYEGIREQRARTLGTITVPTAAEREGDFSRLLSLGNRYQLFDPATRRLNPAGGKVSSPFAGNIIPRARISRVAIAILNYFPLPNIAGTADGQNNFTRPNLAEAIAYSNQAFRLDHNAGARHRLFGSAAMYDRSSDYLNYFDNLSTGEIFQFMSRRVALDDVFVSSSRMVWNFRYACNRFIRAADLNPQSHGFDLTTLAPGNAAYAAWNNLLDRDTRRFPLVDIGGYFHLVGASTSGVLFRPQDTHSFAMAADRLQGSHTLKFGAEYRVYRKGEINPYLASTTAAAGGSATGSLQFGEDWTKGPFDTSAPPPIGAGLASLLLGLPTGGGIDRRASFAEQSTVLALHFQDAFTIANRLSIALGLRYEVEGPLTERFNRSVRGFDPDAALPIAAAVAANYAKIAPLVPELPADRFAIRGGVTFAGIDGQPRTLYGRDTNNFMPRIGLAFRLDANTVVRAGFGIFFGGMGIRRGDVYQTGFGQTTTLVPSRDDGLSFIATLDNPFPNGVLSAPGASQGAMTAVGDQISFFNTGYVAPYVQRWQFSVQRTLARTLTLEASYVGNRGTKLETTRRLSGIPLAYLSTKTTRDQAWIDYMERRDLDNPFYGVLPFTSPLGSAKKINRASLLTANPQFTRVETTTNEGYSWYHSFQAQLEKRFSARHTFVAAYTWSKLMEALAYLNDLNPRPYRTISSMDYPHRFSASWIYELPPLRMRGAGRVLNNWQFDGIYVYQTGCPLAFDNIGFYGDIKNIPLPPDQRSPDRWFNTGAGFVRDSSQVLADNVRTFPLRLSGVRGPSMNNWDLSLLKNARIGEKVSLQFRGEFLNAMNRAWFASPNTTPTSSAFGVITAEQGIMRRIQAGIKLVY